MVFHIANLIIHNMYLSISKISIFLLLLANFSWFEGLFNYYRLVIVLMGVSVQCCCEHCG